jgi:hypothetical protein
MENQDKFSLGFGFDSLKKISHRVFVIYIMADDEICLVVIYFPDEKIYGPVFSKKSRQAVLFPAKRKCVGHFPGLTDRCVSYIGYNMPVFCQQL